MCTYIYIMYVYIYILCICIYIYYVYIYIYIMCMCIYIYIYTSHILYVCYRLPQMQSRLRWLWTNYLGSASARLSTLPWMKSHGLKRLDTTQLWPGAKWKLPWEHWMLLDRLMWTNRLTWFCTSAVMFRTCTVSALRKRKLWEGMWVHHLLLGLGGPDVGHSWACASALHKRKLWENMRAHHILLGLGGPDVGHSWAFSKHVNTSPSTGCGHLYTSQIFSVGIE